MQPTVPHVDVSDVRSFSNEEESALESPNSRKTTHDWQLMMVMSENATAV